MFYVVQVAPGMEDRTEVLIRGRVERGLYDRCFHPMRHVRKKFHGQWKDLHEKLLPGYVFIQSRSIGELYGELQRVPMLTKVLGRDENWFCALRSQEVAWLELLLEEEQEAECCQSGVAEIGLSQIRAEGDTVTILSGPLKNMEGYIRKIHLHRRIAEVEVDFMGRKTVIHLGIEMVEKKET